MARRLLIAATAALLGSLTGLPAIASDRATSEPAPRPPALTALELAVEQIFDRLHVPAADTPAGVTEELPIMEVLMVRVKDGKPVLACVDSKEAARRFLAAPAEKIGAAKQAAEK
jgi:hypothetical protein